MTDISCDCSIDLDRVERPSVCHVEWRKARRKHWCCECTEEIKVGERHEYATGIWDGNWDSHRTCATCVAIRERYCPHGYIYGGLAETIKDCLGFDYRVAPEFDDEEAAEQRLQRELYWARARRSA